MWTIWKWTENEEKRNGKSIIPNNEVPNLNKHVGRKNETHTHGSDNEYFRAHKTFSLEEFTWGGPGPGPRI